MPDWRPLAGPLAAWRKGTGPRLVFVHGFTQTSRSWRHIADHFNARGHETVIVDLPGHGESAAVRADLRRAADLLAATAGEGFYVGYSLGGRVCLHLALMYPHVVDRLAVLGATPGIIDDDQRALRRSADEHLAEHLVDIGTGGGDRLAEDHVAVLGEAHQRRDRDPGPLGVGAKPRSAALNLAVKRV